MDDAEVLVAAVRLRPVSLAVDVEVEAADEIDESRVDSTPGPDSRPRVLGARTLTVLRLVVVVAVSVVALDALD